jgi:hypothetical protein
MREPRDDRPFSDSKKNKNKNKPGQNNPRDVLAASRR